MLCNVLERLLSEDPLQKKSDWAKGCLDRKACVTVYSPKSFTKELRYLNKLAIMNRDVQFVYMYVSMS